MSSYEFTPEVGEPLDRETIRQQEQGFLARCHDTDCDWMGLFPDAEQAQSAVDAHITHAKRSGEMHYGHVNWTVLQLLDDRRARFLDGDAPLPGAGPSQSQVDSHAMLTRSPSDGETVPDLAPPGTHIINNGYGEGVVVQVTGRRASGLPVYSIIYVPLDTERKDDGSYPESAYKYKNQMVAVDGEVYRQWDHDQPEFETNGLADGHQMTFGAITTRGP